MTRKEINSAAEDAKVYKKKVESVKEVCNEIELDLKRRERDIELLNEEIQEKDDKLSKISKERNELNIKFTNAKSENEIMKRELEKAAMDQSDVHNSSYLTVRLSRRSRYLRISMRPSILVSLKRTPSSTKRKRQTGNSKIPSSKSKYLTISQLQGALLNGGG